MVKSIKWTGHYLYTSLNTSTFWAVVVAQWLEQSLLIPEVRGSNPGIGKFLIELLFIVNCIEKTGNGPFLRPRATCIGEGPLIGGSPNGGLETPWGRPCIGECAGCSGLCGLCRWWPSELEGRKEGRPESGRPPGFDPEGGLGGAGTGGTPCCPRTPNRFCKLWNRIWDHDEDEEQGSFWVPKTITRIAWSLMP